MRRVFLILFIAAASASFASAQSATGDADVLKFRALRDEQFRSRAVSPLRTTDFSNFEGLNYFPLSENYRVKATFARTPNEKSFMMPTSVGAARKYRKIGVLKFDLNGAAHTLGAYRREREDWETPAAQVERDLFVPFRDLSNGAVTYAAGRYVYVRAADDADETVLDFNLAFNPSCAYGDPNFACALPPQENYLQTEIRAGEKIYKDYGVRQN